MGVEEYEDEGRKKLKTVFPKIDWKFTKGEKTVFDAYTTYDNKVVIVEIKTRDFATWQYDDCFLELDKYIALSTYRDVNSSIYVAHYTNGKTATWNITNLNPDDFIIKKINMNGATAQGIRTSKMYKDVILLPLSIADIRYTDTGKKTQQYEPKK